MYYYNYYLTPPTNEIHKMLNLIIEVVRFEAVTELTFDYLKVLAPSKEEKVLLQKMLDDEREHFKELKRMYYNITGKSAAGDPPVFIRPESYLLAIEKIFYEKVEIIPLYKKMKKIAPTIDMREQISNFIYDELSHLSMLNHILIKSKVTERIYDYSSVRSRHLGIYY
ncbi:hypothetical protein BKP35_07935 [Anaerobacillus arseniciselenatis]|uniref:Rubrerythrin diiron-binding domain-containing protein n=1 Tax=Anaerobacillus arseniciselenatis TaxID=85682 RepID=A0A1S2LPJ8_9BACI|nr:ferritin-like domain-containing protein [Anaerobacillus arseniciselenatis]OIJ14120.1 hypothetical protein BKP35_07935 [Anaerobacillus arseniciselenatis]